MDIPRDLRKRLVEEIRFVVEIMGTENDPRIKLYYFSAVYGEMSRLLNIHFDRELMFAHGVLNYAYQVMKTRADIIVMGRDTIIDFPDKFFDALTEHLVQLANHIENNEDIYSTLQDITCLAYIATGNGYYLFKKGILRI